jgi:putative endonuclease
MATGNDYETATARWLAARGSRILARNYRCRAGELDIVALDGGQLRFVEVRARSNPRYASAAASVDARKQAKLRRAAAHFLACRWRGATPPCRFDVVVWEPGPRSGKLLPRLIENAF